MQGVWQMKHRSKSSSNMVERAGLGRDRGKVWCGMSVEFLEGAKFLFFEGRVRGKKAHLAVQKRYICFRRRDKSGDESR